MAQRTVIELIDDVDGSAADETVSFGLDGASYEIDLNDEHAADLREVLSAYVGAARRASGARRSTPKKAAPAPSRPVGEADPQTVRAWARQSGLPVSPRGRLKADIVDQYKAAHSD